MLKGKGRNFDNVSIAQTKSSKTLKSKLNNNPEIEAKKFEPPYFKQDNIHKEIEARAKKENSRFSGLLAAKAHNDHLDKAANIMKGLFERHKIAKEKLGQLKQESQTKKQIQCPFQPAKKKLEKFVVEGNVIRRNELWLQQKRKKSVIRKEELLEGDLANCTFTPQISSKSFSALLKNREHSKSAMSRQRECQQIRKPSLSPTRHKDLSKSMYQSAKREIYNRLLSMSDSKY